MPHDRPTSQGRAAAFSWTAWSLSVSWARPSVMTRVADPVGASHIPPHWHWDCYPSSPASPGWFPGTLAGAPDRPVWGRLRETVAAPISTPSAVAGSHASPGNPPSDVVYSRWCRGCHFGRGWGMTAELYSPYTGCGSPRPGSSPVEGNWSPASAPLGPCGSGQAYIADGRHRLSSARQEEAKTVLDTTC